MAPVLQRQSTDPAPSMIANCALHMVAPSVLFNWSLTFRTLMCAHIGSPPLIDLIECLLASLPFVPWQLTLETEATVAIRTCHFLSGLRSLHHSLTVRVRTKFLVRAVAYFVILHEPHKLLVRIWSYQIFN